MRSLVNVVLPVILLACAATTNGRPVRLADSTKSEINLFMAAWLRIPGAHSLDRWLGGDFRFVGATAASLREENRLATDLEVLAHLPWACKGSEGSCPSVDACTRPMKRQGQPESFGVDRLLVDPDVLRAQPALLPWQGETLVEVDLVLSRCETGTTLLFHSTEDRLTLVAAVVAAN